MALPPFEIAENLPGNQDIVSQYPAVERAYRDIVESWLQFEHHTSGHHEFRIDTTANLDADTTWPAGSLRWNTTLGVMQFALSVGPLVWANASGFETGTRMLFQQTAAPLGWTKEVGAAYDDAAIRNVVGTVTPTGGTVGFDTAFAIRTPSGNVDAVAITIAQMPLHGHPWQRCDQVGGSYTATVTGGLTRDATLTELTAAFTGTPSDTNGEQIGGEGGDEAHTHGVTGVSLDIDVKHVDTIVAAKD